MTTLVIWIHPLEGGGMQFKALIFIAMLLCAFVAQASVAEQRELFEQAKVALNNNDLRTYDELKTQLYGYPLLPYLDIWTARKSLKKGDDSTVPEIISRHSDVPESINLRVAWLKHLAKKGQWNKISNHLDQYTADKKRLPEIAMVSLWKRNMKEEALTQFSKRWIKAKRISGYSTALYHAWQKAGHPTKDERWLRIAHHANDGKWKRIYSEKRHLSRGEQKLIAYWQKLQKRPETLLTSWPDKVEPLPARLILADALIRLSRSDVEKAWFLAQQLRARNELPDEIMAELAQKIALRAARQHNPLAIAWLHSLPEQVQTEDTRSWLTRLLIIQQKWQATITAIDAMPIEERQKSNWLYWKARALEESGNRDLADPLYLLLANERGYYSFLSSEKLGLPLKLHSQMAPVSDAEIDTFIATKAIRRAYEWLQIGNSNKASREWHYALQGQSEATWRAATAVAFNWNWLDQTIRSAFKAKALDALDARFPLGYENAVISASKESGLAPSSIWSIIRQESAFNHQAVSYVGAKGLMQLMPRTARGVAKRLKMKTRRPDLFSPETNIRLGSTYLAEMKARFGNLALAAVAYNAGPHRVSRWLSRTSFDSAEAWIEAIPFNETRRYVQQVMAFITIYEWRQSKQPSSLTARIGGGVKKVSLNSTL